MISKSVMVRFYLMVLSFDTPKALEWLCKGRMNQPKRLDLRVLPHGESLHIFGEFGCRQMPVDKAPAVP